MRANRFFGFILAVVSVFWAEPRAFAWQDAPAARLKGIEALGEAEAADPREEAGGVEIKDVRSASFKEIEPGQTTAQEARKLLGDPVSEESKDGVTTLTYRIDPFARVDLLLTEDLATSIIIHLKRSTPAAEIVRDLELEEFRAAPIPEETGKVLGLAFPERGVTLALAAEGADHSVNQVLIEAINAEPFLLRALYDTEQRYEHMLADLEYAAKLDDEDARIPCLTAQVLQVMGRRTEALAAAARAKKLDPTSGPCLLTLGALLFEGGSVAQALAATREALALKGLPPEMRAQAECQLGNMLSGGFTKNYKEAAERYQAAVKLAQPLASSPSFAVRRVAKIVLIESHLGMAACIANGNWQGKLEAAPKWLERAEALARQYAATERGEQLLRLRTARKTLAVLAALRSELNPAAAANLAVSEAKRLLESDKDPYLLRQAAWELGQSIHDAARAEQARGEPDLAFEYLARAIPTLELDLANRAGTPDEKYLLGRLYFVGGAVQAQSKNSHSEAVVWFDKAAPLLEASKPAAAAERGLYGERFVSMGVSYWETSAREEAMRLTKLGIAQIEEAVGDGACQKSALAVPYGNLASMYRTIGQNAQAREFATLAAQCAAEPQRR